MSQKRIPLPMFRTILFATDLSAHANDAFRVACSVASEQATRLLVLTVLEPLPVLESVGFGEIGVPVSMPIEDEPRREEVLQQLRERFVPGIAVDVEYQVRSGAAAEEIVKTAGQSGSELLVMGTHGRGGLDRLLLGSVAEAVMRRAPCACLTVRSIPDGNLEAKREIESIRTILHPTDFSPHSEAALKVARCLARGEGARLVVLHVVPIERVSGVVSEALVDLELGRKGLAEVQQRVEASDLKYPVESHLKRGDAATEILDAAASLGCELIVMGSHGRTGLGRLLLGSTAEAVTRKATCPVLTVKEHVRAPMGEAVTAAPAGR